ncbi:hypothetical protein V6N11_073851 [Hibiscus sabdariffa]|uniref:UspA domain-containing protein n=1 Tax=Hibiscus sabdariffa TaxID=183260 RepID=A0ABR2P4R1_9ROSI
MNPTDNTDHPQLPTIKIHHPSSPHHPTSAATPTPTAGSRRKIGVAVDLSDESAFAVRWAVQNYLRPGDAVILLHVSPTSVLFGADWGPLPQTPQNPETPQSQQQLEDDFDAFTASKAADLAKPLKEAGIHFKIHIVKDHDMRERLCLEVERLGLSAVIMGSRGFGAEKRGNILMTKMLRLRMVCLSLRLSRLSWRKKMAKVLSKFPVSPALYYHTSIEKVVIARRREVIKMHG